MKNRVWNTALPCLFVGLMVIAAGLFAGDNKSRLLTMENYMDMESIRGTNISPDGMQIVFSREWVDKMNDQSRANLWITDSEGKKVRELTCGQWRDSSPVWSPDGRRIAFLSDRDGTTQLHVMWLDTRETAQLTHLESPPSDFAWSPDGKMLTFTMLVPDKNPILPVTLPPRPEGAKWAEPAVVVDRMHWQRDGTGFLTKGYRHIFAIDAHIGGTPRRITSGDFDHENPQWSADGKRIYCSALLVPDAEYHWRESEIYAIDLDTLQMKPLTDRRGPDTIAGVSPDGKWIAYTGYDEDYRAWRASDIYLMNADGGDKRLIAGNLLSSPSALVWSPDNLGLYCLIEEKGVSNIYFVSLKGAIKRITNSGDYLSGLSIAQNGQAAATVSNFVKPGILVTFRLASPERMRELVDVNRDVLEDIKLGEYEELWFKSPDGLDLQGWLIKPAEFDPAKKYPLLMWIHGGPWAMYSVNWNWEWQNFAASGYAVFVMNPRGSTGYGQGFIDGIQYAYPGKDFDDLMAGVDAAIAKGFIDTNNLFVCGGSGGGCLTAWVVGHTDRFRAAASMRPVIDWHSFVGNVDFTFWYSHFRKFPWEDPLEYALRSPLHYVGNVKTPTMVMTGEADLRTPMSQSEEFYRALKIQKKETLLVRMPNEYHGWRRPSHRMLQQLYLKAWFEKYKVHKTGT